MLGAKPVFLKSYEKYIKYVLVITKLAEIQRSLRSTTSSISHYSDVIMLLKLPAFRQFVQPLVQAQIKENIEAPRHGPLCEGKWP